MFFFQMSPSSCTSSCARVSTKQAALDVQHTGRSQVHEFGKLCSIVLSVQYSIVPPEPKKNTKMLTCYVIG